MIKQPRKAAPQSLDPTLETFRICIGEAEDRLAEIRMHGRSTSRSHRINQPLLVAFLHLGRIPLGRFSCRGLADPDVLFDRP